MVNGKLSYDYNKVLVLQLPHIAVNDSKWHYVEILWTYTSLRISVDYIYQVSVPSSYGNDLGEVKQFFFGARMNSTTSSVYDGFRGCMQGNNNNPHLSVSKEHGIASCHTCMFYFCEVGRIMV